MGFLHGSILGRMADATGAFLAGVRLQHPSGFALLVVPVALGLFAWRQRRRGARRLDAVGQPVAVFALRTRPNRGRRVSVVLTALAWVFLTSGVVGPTWGVGEPDGVAVGRDVVLVLDVSRSMLAADAAGPARWRSAVDGAQELVESLRGRGHRVGLIAFAARPKLLAPLTTDTDHILTLLAELDATRPPAEVRPAPGTLSASGTRIGLALRAAVVAHDPRFPGAQDIILLSDGDDPADDREWLTGVSAARQARVPVHAVGFGDPAHDSPVLIAGRLLEATNAAGVRDPVQTRLREDVLMEIASATGGHYDPVRQEPPRLAEFFRTHVETDATRELTDDATPQPRDRSGPFLALAAVCLLAAWLGAW